MVYCCLTNISEMPLHHQKLPWRCYSRNMVARAACAQETLGIRAAEGPLNCLFLSSNLLTARNSRFHGCFSKETRKTLKTTQVFWTFALNIGTSRYVQKVRAMALSGCFRAKTPQRWRPSRCTLSETVRWRHCSTIGNVNPGLINPKRLFNWEGTI